LKVLAEAGGVEAFYGAGLPMTLDRTEVVIPASERGSNPRGRWVPSWNNPRRREGLSERKVALETIGPPVTLRLPGVTAEGRSFERDAEPSVSSGGRRDIRDFSAFLSLAANN